MAGLTVRLRVDTGDLDQALERAAASMAAAMGYTPAHCASIIKQALGSGLSHLPQLRLARAAAEAARCAQEQALRDAWAGDTDG